MSQYFPEPNSSGGGVKVELSKKLDSADLKNKLKKVPTNLSNSESKVNQLDVDKLVPVPVDLSKLSDVAKSDVVKK